MRHIEQLVEERRRINRQIAEAMKATFLGKSVLVTHHRGSFKGTVAHVSSIGETWVMVKNDKTGKSSQRWPLCTSDGIPDVQVIEEPNHD